MDRHIAMLVLLCAAGDFSFAASEASIDLRVTSGNPNRVLITAPDAVSGSITGTGRDRPGPGLPLSVVTASGYSSLLTGKLGLMADSTPASAQDVSGDVRWNDKLTFTSGTVGSPIPLSIRLTVDGTLERHAQPNFGFGIFGPSINLSAFVGWRTNLDGAFTTDTATMSQFQKVGSWSVFGPSTFEGSFSVPSGTPVSISMSLRGNAPFDFSNTASFAIEIPNGVAMSSESGVFLAAVPEPGAYAMLMAGLGLVVFIVRPKKSS